MLRTSFAHLHIARTPKRFYATAPPPGSKEKEKVFIADNLLYAALGISAAAAAYYYFAGGPDATRNKIKPAQSEELMAQKARESLQAGRAHVDEIQGQSKARYNEAKATGQEVVDSARSNVDHQLREAEQRAREAAANVQANVGQFKKSAENTLSGVRESSENLYKDARAATDRKVSELSSEGKEGWLGWLRSGKKEAAGKVAESAEEVKKG